MPFLNFTDVVLNSRLCPSIKFPLSTYTNKLACSQVSIKVINVVSSQLYIKVSIHVKYKITAYRSCVKT